MSNLKSFPYHFLLVAAFQISALYAININAADTSVAITIFLLTVFLTILMFLIFFLITRDLKRSGLIATLYCFLFFVYGRLLAIMNDVFSVLHIDKIILGRNRYLIPILIAVLIACTFWIFFSQWLKKYLMEITYLLNVFGLALVAVAVLVAMSNFDYSLRINKKNVEMINENKSLNKHDSPKRTFVINNKPNVYLLIFDSYPSPQSLLKYSDWDDHYLVGALRLRGFIVNENAFSNYPNTFLSINAFLNMNYVHEEHGFKYAKSKSAYLVNRIKHNSVIAYFKSEGYDVLMPTMWTGKSWLKEEDNSFHDKVGAYLSNEFTQMVVQTSVLIAFKSLLIPMDTLRKDALNTMRYLIQSDVSNRPTFLYSHIIPPHFPFIFRAGGEIPDILNSNNNNNKQFVEQVKFIGEKIIEIVDSIRKRDPDAVIIVRGDHGHMAFVMDDDPLSLLGLSKHERPSDAFIEGQFGILSATYAPYGILIPEESSPVNLFRHLFNNLFNANLEILPDKAFFTNFKKPFKFYDVTRVLSKQDN